MVAGKFLFPPWRNKGKGGVTYALAGQLCLGEGKQVCTYLRASCTGTQSPDRRQRGCSGGKVA